MRYRTIPAAICIFILVNSTFIPLKSLAQEGDDLDLKKIFESFDEPAVQPSIVNQSQNSNSSTQQSKQIFPVVDFSGSFSNIISYSPYSHTTNAGYNVHGLTSLKPRFMLAMDTKFSTKWSAKISAWTFYDFAYILQGRDNYSSEMLEAYENEVELGETYLRGRLTDYVDLTFGRQIIVWGKSDFFRVADIINPIDNRERGLDDLEFKLLPVLMTKLDSYSGAWHFSGLVTHELRYNKDPVYGHDFYPYSFPAPPREDVDNNLKNSSFGGSADRSYPGFDVAFYIGSYLKELDLVGLSSDTPERYNSRLFIAAAAAEKPMGHWLFKAELAYIDGLEYYSIPDESFSRFDVLLGADYTGFGNTRLSMEIVDRHLFDLDSEIADQDNTPGKDELVWAVRAAHRFQRDKYELSIVSYVGGLDFTQGSAQNLSLKHEFNDQITASTGFIFVQSGDNYFMRNVGKNDKVFLKLNYDF